MSFLSSMLPMIAGGALAATGVGAPAAAALIGGLQYARTGSLNKGLMAGLGAYGGAGLASGLAGAGASQASGAIGESAALAGEEAAKQAGSEYAAKQAAINAAGQSATNPAAIEAVAQRQATLNAFPQSAFEQAAKESAVNAYMPTAAQSAALSSPMQTGLSGLASTGGRDAFLSSMGGAKGLGIAGLAAAAPALLNTDTQPPPQAGDSTMPQRLRYDQGIATPFPQPDVPDFANLGQDFGRQRSYFPNAGYQQIIPEQAKSIRGYAGGGLPVEQMSQANAVGMNTGYPQADITGHAYSTASQTPVSQNVVQGTADTGVNRMTGQMLAKGGISDAYYNLGGYSDGGRLLRGPGDGVSDSIPATIGRKQPARLADGEFVVPARIVSELGNGSTEAGARKLYGMMDRVQRARSKTVGKGKVAKNTRADKFLPA
jgi:hypothetical protein